MNDNNSNGCSNTFFYKIVVDLKDYLKENEFEVLEKLRYMEKLKKTWYKDKE